MRIEDEEDDMEDEDAEDSSDDEAGMENKGHLFDEEEDAAAQLGAAAQSQEGPAHAMMAAGDDEEIGMAEARAAMIHNQEMEEAKAELEDLRGSEDEAVYEGANGAAGSGAEGAGGSQEADTVVVGQKRSRDAAANQEANALDLRKLKRQKKMQFMNYYRGAFFGKCSSAIFYELAKQLNKVTSDILWWRIVGFTDQVLH